MKFVQIKGYIWHKNKSFSHIILPLWNIFSNSRLKLEGFLHIDLVDDIYMSKGTITLYENI
jgi:hypothetical protein